MRGCTRSERRSPRNRIPSRHVPVNPWRDLRGWQERLERLTAITPTAGPRRSTSTKPPTATSSPRSCPGMAREQIELAMEDSRLTIRGQPASRRPAGRRPLPPGRARPWRLLPHLRVRRQDRRRCRDGRPHRRRADRHAPEGAAPADAQDRSAVTRRTPHDPTHRCRPF